MLQRLCLTVALLAALGGCGAGDTLDAAIGTSFGGSYDYAALEPTLASAPARSVAVTVIDQRPYVVNGEEGPGFAGTMLGRYRNPVPVDTASGRPLAAVITEALAGALTRAGAEASGVPVAKGTAEAEALAVLGATGAERLLVVRLNEWRTDAKVRVEARWNLEATVHDSSGRVLGRRSTRGAESIGTTGFDGTGEALAVPDLAQRLSRLLDAPAIADALGAA